jgi:hypothetical protein
MSDCPTDGRSTAQGGRHRVPSVTRRSVLWGGDTHPQESDDKRFPTLCGGTVTQRVEPDAPLHSPSRRGPSRQASSLGALYGVRTRVDRVEGL